MFDANAVEAGDITCVFVFVILVLTVTDVSTVKALVFRQVYENGGLRSHVATWQHPSDVIDAELESIGGLYAG
jgi:hypothetical protein